MFILINKLMAVSVKNFLPCLNCCPWHRCV